VTGGASVSVRGLRRSYAQGGRTIDVLKGLDVDLAPGERVALLGPSGCGKSTFLHQLGLLDRPGGGTLLIDGVDAGRLSDRQQAAFRNRRIGFVFQQHHLLPEHTALANAALPARLAGASRGVAETRAAALLAAVGMADRSDHRPGELSGGEQQRVALARALVMAPGLVLADEPTGNLDPATAASVFELLLALHEQLGSTLVVVTHSDALASRFPRRLRLVDGALAEEHALVA
jgi:lipoprotein-releasing system ATP-binding protein